jgi:hypothetical protein
MTGVGRLPKGGFPLWAALQDESRAKPPHSWPFPGGIRKRDVLGGVQEMLHPFADAHARPLIPTHLRLLRSLEMLPRIVNADAACEGPTSADWHRGFGSGCTESVLQPPSSRLSSPARPTWSFSCGWPEGLGV